MMWYALFSLFTVCIQRCEVYWTSRTNISHSQCRPGLYYMSCLVTKSTKWHVRSAKTQISLGIRPVWSESLLSAWRKLGSLAIHWVHSEDSDQMIRLGGCPGWYESSLGTHSFCWFCHEVAHMYCQVPEISKTTDYLSIDRQSVVS